MKSTRGNGYRPQPLHDWCFEEYALPRVRGYTNQNGTLKNNNYQRLNASIGLSPKFFDKHLSVDINIKGSIEDEKPVSTSVIGSAVGSTLHALYIRTMTVM